MLRINLSAGRSRSITKSATQRGRWGSALFAAIAIGLVTSASGEESTRQTDVDTTANAKADIEEIVVTARRRQESEQRIPITVDVLGGEKLSALGIQRLSDLQYYVPNLTINSGFGASNPQIAIRGVGNSDYNDNAQATVGTYVDDVYISAPAGKTLQTYDLESVQVFKGPQGTLFGRNNTSGAILFTSRKPDGGFGGYLKAGVENFGTKAAEGATQFPISNDLSARFAGKVRFSDGYGSLVDPTGRDLRKLGAIEEYAGRMTFRYKSGDLDANLILSATRAYDDRPPFVEQPSPGVADAGGFTPLDLNNKYQNQNNYVEIEKVKTQGDILNLQYSFSEMTLSSVSAFWHGHRFITIDVDHSPNNLLHISRDANSNQFSQELRLASSENHAVRWLGGAYFLRETLNVNNLFGIFSAAAEPNLPSHYENDTHSAALFTEIIWKIAERYSLTLGARETYDKRDFSYLFGASADFSPHWVKPSWRAILDYRATDDAMLYASISHSFQGGGFNGGAFTLAELGNGFRPEYLTAYEIGAKTQWFKRRLTINAATFYYDYKDPQVFALDAGLASSKSEFVSTITNAKSAKVTGLDLDVRARLTDRLGVNIGVGLIDSSYHGLELSGINNSIVSGDGNPLVDAPKLSAVAGADYTIPVSFGTITVHGDVNYKSRRYFDITKRLVNSGDPYGVANARVDLRSTGGHLDFAIYGHNLADKRYLLYTGDLTTVFGFYEQQWGAPRSYGAELSYRW